MDYDEIARQYTKNLAASMKATTHAALEKVFQTEFSKYKIEHRGDFMDKETKEQLDEIPLETLYNTWLIAVGQEVEALPLYEKIDPDGYLMSIGQYLFESKYLILNYAKDTYVLIPFPDTSCKS